MTKKGEKQSIPKQTFEEKYVKGANAWECFLQNEWEKLKPSKRMRSLYIYDWCWRKYRGMIIQKYANHFVFRTANYNMSVSAQAIFCGDAVLGDKKKGGRAKWQC